MCQMMTLDFRLPTLSEIVNESKKHWSKYSSPKGRYTEVIAMVAGELEPVKGYPVSITFEWECKTRRIDPDNRLAGAKYILDGLVRAGILCGDGMKQIVELHHVFKKGSRDAVAVIIEEDET